MFSESVDSTRNFQPNSFRQRNRVRTLPRLTLSTSSPPSPARFKSVLIRSAIERPFHPETCIHSYSTRWEGVS